MGIRGRRSQWGPSLPPALPTTPSSAQKHFWGHIMYMGCEISVLLLFPFCSPLLQSGKAWPQPRKGSARSLLGGLGPALSIAGPLCPHEHEGAAQGPCSSLALRIDGQSFIPDTPFSGAPLRGPAPRGGAPGPAHSPAMPGPA